MAGHVTAVVTVPHMTCDLTIAADNALFGQTGPKRSLRRRLGRFHMARIVGQKKPEGFGFPLPSVRRKAGARHGPVNTVVPLASCNEKPWWVPRRCRGQPDGAALPKAALNADCDGSGPAGVAGNATMLFS
ncbi:enoyl-CoA hydratase-related protein [Escherichia coli]